MLWKDIKNSENSLTLGIIQDIVKKIIILSNQRVRETIQMRNHDKRQEIVILVIYQRAWNTEDNIPMFESYLRYEWDSGKYPSFYRDTFFIGWSLGATGTNLENQLVGPKSSFVSARWIQKKSRGLKGVM